MAELDEITLVAGIPTGGSGTVPTLAIVRDLLQTIDNKLGEELFLPTGASSAAHQVTQNAALAAIQTAVQLLDNAISGTELQVDIVAAIPAGDNNIGNVDVASSVLPTGASTAAKQPALGTVAARSTDVISVMPAVIATKLVVSAATSGDNTILAAQGSGNAIVVHSLFLVAALAVDIRFESAAGGTAITGVMSLGATVPLVLPHNPDGWFETIDNELLNLELGGAVQVSGALTYSVL